MHDNDHSPHGKPAEERGTRKPAGRDLSLKAALRASFGCLLPILLGWPVAVLANNAEELLDMPLDQLLNVEVVSASRFKQKASEAPSSVEVLTADDIRTFGWRTLADALNAIRGLTIRNDRNYTYLGTRGFSRTGDYISRVLVMIDGRRMNEAIFDSGALDEQFMLDINLIDRIEYIPGSGSSVYGANALLGVINVITKKGKDINGVRLTGEAGSLDTYRGRTTLGKHWKNGADLLLNASQYFSHGQDRLYFPEFASVNNGIAEDMDLERSSRLFGEFSYGDFVLRAGYNDRYKRVPTASFGGLFNAKPFDVVDRQAFVDLDYNTQITNDLGLEARGFHQWYNYYALEAYNFNAETLLPPATVANYDSAATRWWGGELKLTGTQFDRHKWILGTEVQYDQIQKFVNYDIDPYALYNDSNNHGWRAGVYVQDEYRITDSLMINAGVRLDHHHMIKTLQLHPRIGLIWEVTPKLTTKLLYGSSFRAPNVYERDYVFLSQNVNNPNNREELVESYEATAEWYPEKGLKLLGTLFYNDLRKILVQDPATSKFVNDGAYKVYGFELEAENRWMNGRLVKFSWTYNYNRDETYGQSAWAADSPKNMVKLHYAEPLFNDALRIGFEEIFVDERRTLGGNLAPGYHLFNINLAQTQPVYGFQASLGLYNVLDQRFKVLGGSEHVQDTLTMDGRTVRFRLEYGF